MRLMFAITIAASFALSAAARAEDQTGKGSGPPAATNSPVGIKVNDADKDKPAPPKDAKGGPLLNIDGVKGESTDAEHKDNLD